MFIIAKVLRLFFRLRRPVVVVVGLLLLVLFFRCWASPPDMEPPVITKLVFEERAEDFDFFLYQGEELLGGIELSFHELLAQGDPVVLNFWGGLCPPCRAEMGDLERLHNQYGGRVTLLGIDVGPFTNLGTRDDGEALLKEMGVSYPAGSTKDLGVMQDYNVTRMPTTVFVKSDGEVTRVWHDIINYYQLEGIVEELIDDSDIMPDGA